jgi:hypothetical protein
VQLGSLLEARGWQYISIIKPAGLHFCFTLQHVAGVEAQIADLKACCEEIRKPLAKGSKADASENQKVYGLANAAVDRDTIADTLKLVQDEFLAV